MIRSQAINQSPLEDEERDLTLAHDACEGREEFSKLLARLTSGPDYRREKAARALREYGAWAVEPLCEALNQRGRDVRIAAAESLGHIGDERAVKPLTEALHACFVGGSARRQRLLGVLAIPALVLILLGLFLGSAALKASGGVGVLLYAVGLNVHGAYKRRRSESRVCEAVTEALERIAERSPTPALRAVVPELKAVAADPLLQEESARAASRQAAARIEALTDRLKDLPLPATHHQPHPANLPRPAEPPDQPPVRKGVG
jgi:hypothetical protein